MRNDEAVYGALKRIVHVLAAVALLGSTPALSESRLVVAYGDSLTAGYGLKPAEAFPVQLESELRREGIDVAVRNAGISGDTSAQGRARLGWVLGALKRKPDLLILELGANDMLRGIDPSETRANLSAILDDLDRRKIPVLLAGMRAAPNMGADYRRHFDTIYPALARRHGVRLYPFFLAGVAGHRKLQLKDNMHPTGPGVAIIVRAIAPEVKAMLDRR